MEKRRVFPLNITKTQDQAQIIYPATPAYTLTCLTTYIHGDLYMTDTIIQLCLFAFLCKCIHICRYQYTWTCMYSHACLTRHILTYRHIHRYVCMSKYRLNYVYTHEYLATAIQR